MTTEYKRGREGAALSAPSRVLAGRYELGRVLGRGGMSEVREGWDLKLGRPVAIKLLQSGPGNGDGPDSRLRFATEARATAALSSSKIVIVHDVGEHHGLPFIVMERLPGVSLADHIARGPLPEPFVRTVLDAVLAALTSAHDAGILHRDVKPGNILFTAAGEAKLADFGIAKTAGGAHTMTGQVVGTMAYLSPDRLAGKPATPADDLYAVGVVGYEALTGRRPPSAAVRRLGERYLARNTSPDRRPAPRRTPGACRGVRAGDGAPAGPAVPSGQRHARGAQRPRSPPGTQSHAGDARAGGGHLGVRPGAIRADPSKSQVVGCGARCGAPAGDHADGSGRALLRTAAVACRHDDAAAAASAGLHTGNLADRENARTRAGASVGPAGQTRQEAQGRKRQLISRAVRTA